MADSTDTSSRAGNEARHVQCCYPDALRRGARCKNRQYGVVCRTHLPSLKPLPNHHILQQVNRLAYKYKQRLEDDDDITRDTREKAEDAHRALRLMLCLHLLPEAEVPEQCHFLCPGPGIAAGDRCSQLVDPAQGFCPSHQAAARNERNKHSKYTLVDQKLLGCYKDLLRRALAQPDDADACRQVTMLSRRLHDSVDMQRRAEASVLQHASASFARQQTRQACLLDKMEDTTVKAIQQARQELPMFQAARKRLRERGPVEDFMQEWCSIDEPLRLEAPKVLRIEGPGSPHPPAQRPRIEEEVD